jgi:hypothetical protein
VLTNALEDLTIIGGKTIGVVNAILKYSYVGLLLTCFIIALGNRPQGSSRTYTLAFVGYAIFTLYMTVRYCDRRWYVSELADSESKLVCCDVPDSQRRAAGT